MTDVHTAAEAGRPTTEKVRGVFSRIARRYDMMNSVMSFGLHHVWRRRTVAEAGLTPGCAVLDVAAGTGDLALALARTGLPSKVVATDFVSEMLDIARAKAQGWSGPTELEFEIQDGQALTFPDASFDVVTVSFGIRNMPDRAAGFREAFRVLKDGGRYLILEFTAPRERRVPPAVQALHRRDRRRCSARSSPATGRPTSTSTTRSCSSRLPSCSATSCAARASPRCAGSRCCSAPSTCTSPRSSARRATIDRTTAPRATSKGRRHASHRQVRASRVGPSHR